MDVLDLGEVDILVYDFQLTTNGRLRKKTIDILFEKVPSYAPHLVGASSSRLTRLQMEEALGLHRDEDNVLVDSVEEDGSSTSGSSSNHDKDLNGYETLGIDTEEDAFVE